MLFDGRRLGVPRAGLAATQLTLQSESRAAVSKPKRNELKKVLFAVERPGCEHLGKADAREGLQVQIKQCFYCIQDFKT